MKRINVNDYPMIMKLFFNGFISFHTENVIFLHQSFILYTAHDEKMLNVNSLFEFLPYTHKIAYHRPFVVVVVVQNIENKDFLCFHMSSRDIII